MVVASSTTQSNVAAGGVAEQCHYQRWNGYFVQLLTATFLDHPGSYQQSLYKCGFLRFGFQHVPLAIAGGPTKNHAALVLFGLESRRSSMQTSQWNSIVRVALVAGQEQTLFELGATRRRDLSSGYYLWLVAWSGVVGTIMIMCCTAVWCTISFSFAVWGVSFFHRCLHFSSIGNSNFGWALGACLMNRVVGHVYCMYFSSRPSVQSWAFELNSNSERPHPNWWPTQQHASNEKLQRSTHTFSGSVWGV